MKKTFVALTGILIFGFLLSLNVSAQSEIKKEDNKTVTKERTVTVKNTDNAGTVVKSDGTQKPKAPCDPAHCKTSCKDKKAKKSCCPSRHKATKSKGTDPKKK